MKLDPVWFTLLSELFVNLSAGWFGAVFVISPIVRPRKKFSFWVLTADLLFAIVSLVVAFELKKQAI